MIRYPGGATNAAGAEVEYENAVQGFPKDLPLPKGQSFPVDPSQVLTPDAQYDPGAGEAVTYFYWRCAWGANYLTAFNANQTAAENIALDFLDDWSRTAWFKAQVTEDQPDAWHKTVVEPARLGDPSSLKEFDTSDCIYYDSVNNVSP